MYKPQSDEMLRGKKNSFYLLPWNQHANSTHGTMEWGKGMKNSLHSYAEHNFFFFFGMSSLDGEKYGEKLCVNC